MPFMPGLDNAAHQQAFLLLFSGMSGAIAMIRLLPDATAREQALMLARAYYLESFASENPT